MKPETRREVLAIAVALSPFAVLAILGGVFDQRVVTGVVLFLALQASGVACFAFFAIRFRNVNRERLPRLVDIPKPLVLSRALLPFVCVLTFFAFVVLADRPAGKLPPSSIFAGAAAASLCFLFLNLLWRRWVRSIGFDPDAVLVSMHHGKRPPAA